MGSSSLRPTQAAFRLASDPGLPWHCGQQMVVYSFKEVKEDYPKYGGEYTMICKECKAIVKHLRRGRKSPA